MKPSRINWLYLLMALLTIMAGSTQTASSQPDIKNYLEYAIGKGMQSSTRLPLTLDADGTAQADIPASELAYGLNSLALRLVAVSDGQTYYSPTMLKHVYKYPERDAQAVAVEYRIDDGVLQRQAIEPDADGSVAFDIDASQLHYGLNMLAMRLVSRRESGNADTGQEPTSSLGIFTQEIANPDDVLAPEADFDISSETYSPMVLRPVYKYHAQDAHTVGVEYSLNGSPFVLVAAEGSEASFDLSLDDMLEGINVLALRAVSENSETGRTLGATTYRYVYRPANAGGMRAIQRVEYYWDNDPASARTLEFTTDGELALVDCDIDTRGLYGQHVLCLRAYSEGAWSPLYQQTVDIPLLPLMGTVVLDPSRTEDEYANVFQSLPSLFRALSQRGAAVGLSVSVADATYTFSISEESLQYVKTLATLLSATNLYFDMRAPTAATFNFTLPMTFIAAHQSELTQIVGYVQTLFNHVVTTNISITINGQVYNYDGFQVEPNDLLALKDFYRRLGGEQWTKPWSFQSNGRNISELPGVTCDEAGRVTAIELEQNNLYGELNSEWQLGLPYCRTLRLAKNNIYGDIAPWLHGQDMLVVDLSYNCLSLASDTICVRQSLDLGYQYVSYRDGDTQRDALRQAAQPYVLYMSNSQELVMPSLFRYDGTDAFTLQPSVHVLDGSGVNFASYGSGGGFTWKSGAEYTGPQDAVYTTRLSLTGSPTDGSLYPAKLRYVMGDANMSGATDVIDVQHTLNRILFTAAPFNYSAANTYADELINVQDIVCTVNIIMGTDDELATARSFDLSALASRRSAAEPLAGLLMADGQLSIRSLVELGALDVELRGVTTSQVSLLLNRRHYQLIGRNTASGSRYVIFSPTGWSIPAGELTALLRISGAASLVAAQVADISAAEVPVALGSLPTGIGSVASASVAARFEGSRLLLSAARPLADVSLTLTDVGGSVVLSRILPVLAQGTTALDVQLPAGVYLLQLSDKKQGIRQSVKLLKP